VPRALNLCIKTTLILRPDQRDFSFRQRMRRGILAKKLPAPEPGE
jgi:hypothetical protein